jgi:hypothetical protein
MLCSISKLRVFVTMAHHIDHTEDLTDAEVSLNHDTLSQDVKGISSILHPIDNRLQSCVQGRLRLDHFDTLSESPHP